jgi:dynein heavy chain
VRHPVKAAWSMRGGVDTSKDVANNDGGGGGGGGGGEKSKSMSRSKRKKKHRQARSSSIGDGGADGAAGAASAAADSATNRKGAVPRPAFILTLSVIKTAKDGPKLAFESPLQELNATVARVYDNIISGLNKISRVENKVFQIMDETKYLSLNVDGEAADTIWALKDELVDVFAESTKQSQAVFALYNQFSYVLDEDVRVEAFLKAPHTLDACAAEIIKYRALAARLTQHTCSTICTPSVLLHCKNVNEIIVSRIDDLSKQILTERSGRLRDECDVVSSRFKAVSQTLRKKPLNVRELVALVAYLQNFRDVEQDDLNLRCLDVRSQLDFLFDQRALVGHDVLSHIGVAWAWLQRIDDDVRQSEAMVAAERDAQETRISEERDDFDKLLESYEHQVAQFNVYGDVKKIGDYLSKIAALNENIASAEQTRDVLREQEELLDMPETPFFQLDDAKKRLEPYEALWNLVRGFNQKQQMWMRGPVIKLDADVVAAEVEDMWKRSFKLAAKLKDGAPDPSAVAQMINRDLSSFKPQVPLLQILCHKGMRDRHWAQVGDVVGFDLRPDQHTSLTRVLDMGIDKYVEQLEIIAETASREFSIENAITSMKEEWAGVRLDIKSYRDTGTYILQGDSVEEVQILLDDHLVKTQTMKGSPYAVPFQEQLGEWEAWLQLTTRTVEVWLKVQAAWMYLEPVFGAEDIIKQMPAEGTMFKVVDSNWHKLFNDVARDTTMTSVMAIKHILEILQEALSLLDTIQAGLNAYLETKRLFFPRFYFLSNDELLEILSETKDPLRVQPHLKKCFDGISKLEFKHNLSIVAMMSKEGERVRLVRSVNPVDAKGAVERWLKEVEQVMRETVLDQAQQALKAYTQSIRGDWVSDWPGQIVLCANQIHWTENVGKALRAGRNGLKELLYESNEQLQHIVMKVRGQLTPLMRITLGALVVVDVHSRDVVESLIANEVDDAASFEWTSQMRYYWEDNLVKVRMITHTMNYGCEYIGNSGRLVITQLTDRCYRTLMGALQLNLGGAPEGPAGTGKTETVKDLSKAVAIQCVVFNCSDGLDYLAMGKFFKGLASSGAWACFDEFNRIELEVLSVVAQQIQTILRAKESRVSSFVFEGTELSLRPTCSVFITMNPGYAGRSDLPDNLKALFRTVAMMVPDYAAIAEIELYSYGFVDARGLSRKIVATYKLCSEQLSSQDHYDYGMRAVQTVLRAASVLKQKFPKEKENLLMLRSLVDVNLPKFLSPDIPLFEGIISDLFPAVELLKQDHGALEAAVLAAIEAANLRPEPIFVAKILQLYETVTVRHGLMIVGLPFAGKTAAYQVLAAALGDLAEKGEMNERAVKVDVINPKSITMGQLYGSFDPLSHEWNDGVLALKFRSAANDASKTRRWVVFDGPVDAIWIENMNTVLDDNKKLCLMSGEIIQMSDNMNMIFEVGDLAVASPATVSRCGMVYLEPEALGYRPLLISWLHTLPPGVSDHGKRVLESLFDWLVPPCLRCVRKLTFYAPASDGQLCVSLMRIVEGVLSTQLATEEQSDEMGVAMVTACIESCFLWALVWSIGGSVDTAGRVQFAKFLRDVSQEVNNYKLSVKLPIKGSLYDYYFDPEVVRFGGWDEMLDAMFTIPEETKFSSILVPTTDSVKYTYLLNLFVQQGKPVLLVGPTGTGKTMYTADRLRKLAPDSWKTITLSFSAQTSAQQTQMLIDDKLDRRKRGVFGPSGGRRCVLFVDDVNMPRLEKYGAQPPVELLRQLIGQGGWYDLKEKSAFRSIVDVQVVCAMGPPGGGRNQVTDRFLRHFSPIAVTPFDNDILEKIFSTILDWHFTVAKFGKEFMQLNRSIVNATRDIYNTVSANLLPTPAKSHYTFNLRDVSRVIQGVCMSEPEQFPDTDTFIRLWVHEVHRVFCDRLVDNDDQLAFLGWVRATTSKFLSVSFDKVFAHLDTNGDKKVDTVDEIRNLWFGDYLQTAMPRPYAEITSTGTSTDLAPGENRDITGSGTPAERLRNAWENYLSNYNTLTTKPMKLVMFRFAIEHASRIARILKQPGGNALLVGVGGSGKQSLTRLAAHVMDYDVIQIQLSQSYGVDSWRDDLRRLLRKAGGEGKNTVFLMTDSQMVNPQFMEDVNGLLNAGEVPNLWEPEQFAEICELVRPAAKAARRALDGAPVALYQFFVERVKEHLHVVLCMSPIGNTFRDRIRILPSLVACCTIDWFQAWPLTALESVASTFLGDVDMGDDARAACSKLCIDFHRDVEALSEEFYDTTRRRNYVTPTSYLELIITFQTLLAQKRKTTSELRSRYRIGLEKLAGTATEIKVMQADLTAMQPVLAKTSEETDEMLKIVTTETRDSQHIRDNVAKEEAVANVAAAKAKAIETECAAELAEAMPILDAAINALDTLTMADISEMKAMRNPPHGVKLVMEALCVMKKIPAARVLDPAGSGRMVEDFWGPSVKHILGDPKMLQSLKEFDKDNVPAKVMKALRKYLVLPEFDLAKIKNVSKAAHAVCSWIYAIEAYDRVIKVVRPKQESLVVARAEFDRVNGNLKAKQAELAIVEHKIQGLNDRLAEMQEKKLELENNMDLCAVKIERANKLLGGLGGEKTRWTAKTAELGDLYDNLTGDILLASAVVSYLGAFTAAFRSRMLAKWTAALRSSFVSCSDDFSLVDVLGNPVDVRAWTINGPPNDTFSIDNAVIVYNARRWPLMIDPEYQANRWVKSTEKDRKLVVIKQTEDFQRQLESAVQFGFPCLLEDVGEELEPALEPLLLKQVFKKSGVKVIKVGDADIEYNDNFRLYITTKLRNPHYLPEVATKVTLLNFMITPEGLTDQLLGIVVAKEKPDLENERIRLVVEGAANQKQLKELEDQILEVLSSSKGNILDDEHAIEVLSASKQVSDEIKVKQSVSEKTQAEIAESRAGYIPVAEHSSVLFFCIADLAVIDPMYQYSLAWFIGLYERAIADCEFDSVLEHRLHSLTDYFTHSLYNNVCRSLLEKDKMLFSFLLALRVRQAGNNIDAGELRFLLTGGVAMAGESFPPRPQRWLSDKAWAALYRVSKFPAFAGLADSFHDSSAIAKDASGELNEENTLGEQWRGIYDSSSPHRASFPGRWDGALNAFQKIVVLRCIRPDKLIPAAREFVESSMGRRYVEYPAFDLPESFKDSSPAAPIVFVLSTGSDPMAALNKFASDMLFADKTQSISLGQGQGPIAAGLIAAAVKVGHWVVLQNCHLAVSWMPELERIVQSIDPKKTHPSFRLWMTSYPSKDFPVSILQDGIKLTMQQPRGVRANLLNSFSTDPISEDSFFHGCKNGDAFHSLLFSLCFFHAVVQERRSFGPLGWNIPYEFNETDLNISVRQLRMFLDESNSGVVPFKALRYLTGQCNYGGRVTDDWDRRTLVTLLNGFFTEDALSAGYQLSASGLYMIPADGEHQAYIDYIKTLPQDQKPELFGLHENADITKDEKETNSLLASVLRTQSAASGAAAKDKDQTLIDLATAILEQLPPAFDIPMIAAKYPVSYNQSMNTVLRQECLRYNRLTAVIRTTLTRLQKALIGEVVMSSDLEAVGNEMFDGRVPAVWMAVSYPSLKPLGSYVTDLEKRLNFLIAWCQHDAPTVTWISGIFFTQSFLTGLLQDYARKNAVAIDEITFDFQIMDGADDDGDNAAITARSPKPVDGGYIDGLYLEGAKWDVVAHQLAESDAKVLFTAAPVIWLKPCRLADVSSGAAYNCPMYRTTERRGQLSTTGHSTNYVTSIRMPTGDTANAEEHWTRRGVALVTQLQ